MELSINHESTLKRARSRLFRGFDTDQVRNCTNIDQHKVLRDKYWGKE
jgi:hypothetical protein